MAGAIFGHWRTALSSAFVADGFAEPDAWGLAVTSIATLEGAVVLCRAHRSVTPLHDVVGHLEFLIRAHEFVRRYGLPSGR